MSYLIYIVRYSCVALTEKLTRCRNELEKLNTQVLNLVEQKLDLAQQLEMWEVHTKRHKFIYLEYSLSREMWSVWLVTMYFSS